jgi:IS605 OrfB family transposase
LADNKGNPDRNLTDEERKKRRSLLALSWLSVESMLGAPASFIIASGKEDAGERNGKVVAALEEILEKRGVAINEINEWKDDCNDSLSAAIREDAVWVNRSKAFDEAVKSIGYSITEDDVWDMLKRFFVSPDDYLAPAKGSNDESSEPEHEEKAKDLVQTAGQWLSSRFGTGGGADFPHFAIVYQKIADWALTYTPNNTGTNAISDLASVLSELSPETKDLTNDLQGVIGLVSGPGYKSATRNYLKNISTLTIVTQADLTKLKETATVDKEKCEKNSGSKGPRPYSDAIMKDVESVCGFTYRMEKNGKAVSVSDYSRYDENSKWGSARHSEFAVILDHAARRVSLAHTWIKIAEAERHRFVKDTQMMANLPRPVKDWLDSFCLERSIKSGALEPYRIRRRAVDGWVEVVSAWSKSSCNTSADRIAVARALQDNPEIDKFGDIQLFEALAEDDAVCVWHKDGDAAKPSDPQPLIDYALATEAEFKKRHFKVPAYRHPDPFLHPIFCDFGNSRWAISFTVHKNELEKITPSSLRELSLTLWTGSGMLPEKLCWQSKKLAHDLALGQDTQNDFVSEVSRADRLGRAASNVPNNNKVKISGLFEQEDWNGRLQAPRKQLEAIALVRDSLSLSDQERDRRLSRMKDRIRWLITFSAKLQPQGPWCDFAEQAQLRIDPKYWPHADLNKNRKSQARLILSRLPGLRLLSVDLGHRHAAACAVWEALSTEKVKAACLAAGHREPIERDLYLHLKMKIAEHGKSNQVEVEKTTIYRRIGAETLPDGTKHPAPWARLDRQFLIKLQGEEEGVRKASNEELWMINQLETSLGRSTPIIDKLVKAGWGQSGNQKTRLAALSGLGWKPPNATVIADVTNEDEADVRKPSLSVDELMSSVVRFMRLAIKRHGDRARIAFALTADYKIMPGDCRYYFTEAKDLSANDSQTIRKNKHIEFIQDALVLWYSLTSSPGWQDDAAKQLWEDHVAKFSDYKAPEIIGEDTSGVERKKKQKENRERLYGVAKALTENATLRKTLHEAFKTRWEHDDEQWRKLLRRFKDWILPSGKPTGDPAIRKVGGLSLTRLSTLTEFRRKVQVGFFTRIHPDGTRTTTKGQFAQRTLDALEHLREQRIKQLASRIAEAALGIGRIKLPIGGKVPKRPEVSIDEPCHAIAIEDLTHYRPEETRTRRENRQLMTWSSSKVKKYLSEACQLHGLHLREVSASYTSRQDSRTGAPGIRCQDVPVNEFMRSPFWRKQIAQAEKKLAEGKGDSRERFLCELKAMWKDKKTAADWDKAVFVRVPLKGGEIFVSADPASPAAKGLHADLNAAANIGLRALTDPDWPGKWWYVPCDPVNFRPKIAKVGGSAAVNTDLALRQPAQTQTGDAKAKKKSEKESVGRAKEIVNLWRNISSSPLECLEFGEWKEYAAYQNEVQFRVVGVLAEGLKGRSKQPHSGTKTDAFSSNKDATDG